jgi:ferredoxin
MSQPGVIERAAESVAPPPVRVVVALCPSQRSVKSGCRQCVTRCPVDAIEFREQRFDVKEICSGCGVCYAACPTGAVELRQRDDRTLALALRVAVEADPGKVARITCEKDSTLPGGALVLPCLGRLTENLVVAALAEGASRVEVKVPECEGCPMARGMEGFEQTVELARALCRLIGRPDSLVVVDQFEGAVPGAPAAPPESAYSRREFFRAFRRQAAVAVADALPAAPQAPTPVSAWGAAQNPRRSHLLELLARFPTTGPTLVAANGFPFATLQVNDNCVGCNVCEALCPTGALTRNETAESFALRFDPGKCVNCQVCAKACYTRAIRLQVAVDLKSVLHGGETEVIRFQKRRCEICGQPSVARGETLCFACVKRRRLLRRVFEQSGEER